MLEFLKNTYVVLATVPYLTFLVIWGIAYLFIKERKAAIRVATDITTFFLVGSVAGVVKTVFGFSFMLWFIILLLLIAFGLIGGHRYEKEKKPNLIRVGRTVWRTAFIILAALYIVLLLVQLIGAILG
ncbi:DUF3397 domain-containing protein [Paenibacillus sp. N1-5-1-14]|uniref:DUF3397 domain-containing protein n=1 Tax=Paenibacillus radicibacter TaxID=2972488 RepID=UPI002158D1DE|nr:DUF3397 domain-containing protein [Paenibacillus radicibacter]MCR8641940.1 DUF3397 domain-containing protein [Paenibacillus radicibacter]